VICNVQYSTVIFGTSFIVVIAARRKGVCTVGLPQANVNIEGRCKRRYFHVVGPLAGLAHLLDVQVKLALQLLLGVICCVDSSGSGGGLAFGIAARRAHGHVLAVEVGIQTHVSNCRVPQCSVQVLVAVELVAQCIEKAVSCFGQPELTGSGRGPNPPSPLVLTAYRPLASRIGNSALGELVRGLRDAMLSFGC
jgi:hypothetical protein